MKKLFVAVIAFTLCGSVSAQVFLGASVNYSSYRGNVLKSTPGAKFIVGYNADEKKKLYLSYTYGAPIKKSYEETYINSFSDLEYVPAQWTVKFSTISIIGEYTLIGDNYEGFSLYVPVGGSFVIASQKQKLTGTPSPGYYAVSGEDDLENETGFTLNGGIGAQYSTGTISIFGDGGIAFPANQINNQYVENYIPTHFTFNLGIRFNFGVQN